MTTTPAEKRKLIKYGLACRGKIKGIISIVNYSTFRRWVNGNIHNKYEPAKQGMPRKTTQEIIAIIIRFARENLDWGYGRIMGELKKLNVIRLSRNTIKNIMRQKGLDPAPKRGRDNRPIEYRSEKSTGKLKCDSRLGGMIRHYYWG